MRLLVGIIHPLALNFGGFGADQGAVEISALLQSENLYEQNSNEDDQTVKLHEQLEGEEDDTGDELPMGGPESSVGAQDYIKIPLIPRFEVESYGTSLIQTQTPKPRTPGHNFHEPQKEEISKTLHQDYKDLQNSIKKLQGDPEFMEEVPIRAKNYEDMEFMIELYIGVLKEEGKNNETIENDSIGVPEYMLRLVPDTGSGNVWVNGVKHEGRHHYEVPQKYKTDDNRVQNTFGTGATGGWRVFDRVSFGKKGPYMLENFKFAVTEQDSGGVFQKIPIEGIAGLSLDGLTERDPELDNWFMALVRGNNDGKAHSDGANMKLDPPHIHFLFAPHHAGESAMILGKLPQQYSMHEQEVCFDVEQTAMRDGKKVSSFWQIAMVPPYLELEYTVPISNEKIIIPLESLIKRQQNTGEGNESISQNYVETILPKIAIFDSGTNLYAMQDTLMSHINVFLPEIPNWQKYKDSVKFIPDEIYHMHNQLKGKRKRPKVEEEKVPNVSTPNKKVRTRLEEDDEELPPLEDYTQEDDAKERFHREMVGTSMIEEEISRKRKAAELNHGSNKKSRLVLTREDGAVQAIPNLRFHMKPEATTAEQASSKNSFAKGQSPPSHIFTVGMENYYVVAPTKIEKNGFAKTASGDSLAVFPGIMNMPNLSIKEPQQKSSRLAGEGGTKLLFGQLAHHLCVLSLKMGAPLPDGQGRGTDKVCMAPRNWASQKLLKADIDTKMSEYNDTLKIYDHVNPINEKMSMKQETKQESPKETKSEKVSLLDAERAGFRSSAVSPKGNFPIGLLDLEPSTT